MAELVGTTKVPRYVAGAADNLLATITFFVAATAIGDRLTGTSPTTQVVISLASTSVFLLYYFLFEWLVGATPAKLFAGLRVCKVDGSKCDAKAALIRTAARLIEVNPFLFGCLPAAIIVRMSPTRQRLGDKWAGTVVVETGG